MFPLLQSRCYGVGDRQMLYNAARGNKDFIQRLTLERKLEVHTGCVNSICWNEKGTRILSGSDDQHLVITDPFSGRIVHKIRSGHRANIFSAKFLPSCNDMRTVSCSGDGKIYYTNIERDDTYGTYMFDCHFGTTYEVIVIPNEASTFLSCGEDGTVRFFDLRAKTSCNKASCKDDVLISCRSALTAITANPLFPWQLGVGCSDSSVRIYDRRMLGTRATGNYAGRGIHGLISSFTPPNLKKESYRVTSLNFSPDGEDVLVSYSSEFIYLFGTNDPEECRKLPKQIPKPEVIERNTTESETKGSAISSEDSTSQQNDETVSRAPPVKRLRLRGDWSDTGPGARPERERQSSSTEASGGGSTEGQPSGAPPAASVGGSRAALLNRMSDVLTRWLRQSNETPEQDEGNSQGHGPERGQERGQGQVTENSDTTDDGAQSDPPENTASQSSNTVLNQSTSHSQAQSETGGQRSYDDIQCATPHVLVTSASNENDVSTDHHCGLHTNNLPESSSQHSVEKLHSTSRSPSQELVSSQRSESSRSSSQELVSSQRSDPESSDSKSDESQSSFVHKIQSMNVEDNDSRSMHGISPSPVEQTAESLTEEDRSAVEATTECGQVDVGKELYNPLQPTSYPGFSGAEKEDGRDNNDFHESLQSAINESVASEGDTGNIDCSKDSESVLQKSSQCENPTVDSVTDRKGRATDQDETSHSDDDPPYMVETGRYRETVSAAVNTLRAQNVKPVVSLHYSPEGTSASTIKVGFTRFQSLEEEIDQQNPSVGNEESPDVVLSNVGVSDNHVEASLSNDSDINKRNSNSREHDIDDFESHSDIRTNKTKSGEETVSDSLALESDGYSDNVVAVSERDGSVQDEIKQGASALETEICDSGGAFKPFSVKTADNEQHLLLNEQSEQSNQVSETLEQHHDMPSCSYSNTTSSVGESAMTSDTVLDSASRNNTVCSDGAPSVQESAEVEEMEINDEQSNSQPVDDTTSTNEPAARPRQRRVGHSGPPTGNFQLQNTRGASSGDSSSEGEEESAASNRRTDFERTTAALKLQAFHRLRQEAKEKKEMESKNIFMPKVKQVYKGHRNARTMIKESNFWGDRFVLSGSDCGHVFIWDRYSAEVVMLLEADKHVVNCIQPHPYETTLATSGIDYDVKIWAPLLPNSGFDTERASEVMHRNAIMLEETRDTITVPAIFMLRVLASINNIQSGRRAGAAGRQEADNEEQQQQQHSDTD